MTQEEQFGQILTLLSANSKGISELKTSMNEMTKAKEEIEAWKPEVDNRMAHLETAVTKLGERFEHLLGANTLSPPTGISTKQPATDASKAEKDGMPDPAHLGSTPTGAASGPCGHCSEHGSRGTGFGVVYTTPKPSPVTGADPTHNPPVTFTLGDSMCCGHHLHHSTVVT